MSVEPNDTIPNATLTGLSPLDPGTFSTAGNIGDNLLGLPENDVDLFEVQANAGDLLIADIDADEFGSSLDSVLRIFDAAGNELAVSDDNPAPDELPSLDSFVELAISSTGIYYVGVSSFENFTYDPFVADSGSGSSTGDYSIEITLESVAPIVGTDRADFLTGTSDGDVIEALRGNDTALGLQGDDSIFGGDGSDLLFGGDGFDLVRGGRGADIIFGDDENGFDPGDDELFGEAGRDELFGGFGFDTLAGGRGGDRLQGDAGDDLLLGEQGSDLLQGGFGFDSLEGGSGNDTLTGVALDSFESPGAFEEDLLVGGTGSDTFVLGTSELVFYDDGDPLSGGDSDFARIVDFNPDRDSIQLRGSAELYRLDGFVSGGVSSVALLFDTDTARAETIAILENIASGDLDLASPAFLYV